MRRSVCKIVIRRLDPFPLVFAPVMSVLILAIVMNNSAEHLVGGSWIVLMITAYCYLGGPTAHVVVTPHHVIVANIFVRYRVPRSLVNKIGAVNGVQVHLTQGKEIQVRAFVPAVWGIDYRSDQGYRGRAHRLTEALAKISAELSVDTIVVKSARLGNIIFAVSAPIALMVAFKWMVAIKGAG